MVCREMGSGQVQIILPPAGPATCVGSRAAESTCCGGKREKGGGERHFQKMSPAMSSQDKLREDSHSENQTSGLCLSR